MEMVFKNSSLNYLNCRIIQIANYFHSISLPLEFYYYEVLESTDKVLSEIIELKKRKWKYKSNVLIESEMNDLGINPIRIPFKKLIDIKNIVQELLERNVPVFLWVKASEVTHNPNLDQESKHSIMVESYSEKDGLYQIRDIPFFSEVFYKFNDLARMCDDIPEEVRGLLYFEFSIGHLDTGILERKLKAYICNYHDKLVFFEYLKDVFLLCEKTHNNLKEDFQYIDDALSIIAGSRYLFANALKKFEWNEVYYKLFMTISENVEKLKIMISIGLMRQKYDQKKIVQTINKIKKMEHEAIFLLKSNLKKNDEELYRITSDLKIDPPSKPLLDKFNSTNMKIKWDESPGHIWVTSYEIYKDGEAIGTSRQLQFNITDIEPNHSYAISLKAVDIFGNRSEMSLVNHIVIDTSIDNSDFALYKGVVTSSEESMLRSGDNVVDGKNNTRWGSLHSEEVSWVYIDLGKEMNFSAVTINWEHAYATRYKIQVSGNTTMWTNLYENELGKGGIEEITGLAGCGRYIRITCEEKATAFGYSIWNLSVYA
ncbi:discoidin domain-containing protein [Paenibacillus sp. NPDC057967]|uniref:discoidin domain-containing protein n=1 Tax=Paenibacillus sp. NPDC057967 TaxID=3346293 RepID=UPI0036DCCBED